MRRVCLAGVLLMCVAAASNAFADSITTPSLTTTPSCSPFDCVLSLVHPLFLFDAATLSGGNNPKGTITFQLNGPSNNDLGSIIVSVVGNGTYTSSSRIQANTAGTYTWIVDYSGDMANAGVEDRELQVVKGAAPVPEPSSLCMALTSIALVGLISRAAYGKTVFRAHR